MLAASTGQDESFDEFVDWSDLDFLEQLAVHLAAQAPPRSLRLAMEAIPEPPGDELPELDDESMN